MGYNRVVLKGTSASGEIWQTSFALREDAGVNMTSTTLLQTFVNDDANGSAWLTPLTAVLALANTTVQMITLRAEYRDDAGHVQAAAERALNVTGGTSSTNAALPMECAVVASLRTSTPGGTGRGRMYLPLNAVTRTATGDARIASGTPATIASNVKALLVKAVAAATATVGSSSWHPVVASQAGGVQNLHIVTSIKVGDVIDAQRRRRNRLIENYSSVNYP